MKKNKALRHTIIYATLLFLFLPALIPAQAPAQPPNLSEKEIKVLIDSLSHVLSRYYIYPDKAKLMASGLKKKLSTGAYKQVKDVRELDMLLNRHLQELHKDGHLGLRYDPFMAKRLETPATESQQRHEQEEQLNMARESNFAFTKTEILTGNIGYVRCDGFYPFVSEAKPTLDAAFRFVSHCRALIIDMRYNGGGSPNMVLQTQSYFFDQPAHLNDIIYRTGDTLKRFSNPSSTEFKLNMPVYVLTSRRTFSGGEDFAYGLQHAGRAITVGDTTGGGAHPTEGFSIGQGFIANIPFARAPEGADWEGIGVRPDIAVPSDEALTKAQLKIWTDLLNKANDGLEKMKVLWQMNALKAAEPKKIADTTVLRKYAGLYGGALDFYVKNSHLLCRNGELGNRVFELEPIEDDLFVLDENVQVLFVKDSTGTYAKLNMRWKNGFISDKWKEGFGPAPKKTITLPETLLEKYAGVYLFEDKFASIVKKEDTYYYYSTGVYAKMYFTTEKDFFNTEFSSEKQFESNAAGEITGFARKVNGTKFGSAVRIRNIDTLMASADLINSIGWHLLESKKYAEAARYLKRGLQLYPGDLGLQANLAHACLFNNDYKTAAGSYKKNLNTTIGPGYTWIDMMQKDFEFFKINKFPQAPMDKIDHELGLNALIAKSKEEQEKRIRDWTITRKRAGTGKAPEPAVLKQYQGLYEGGLDFYMEENHLLCRNAERGNTLFDLKHIEKDLFQLDENVQVEFVKNTAGIYSKIKMHWSDGSVSEKKKM